MSTFKPSPQQSDFFNWITNDTGSCILEAVAGAGKTTTLIKALELMFGSIFFGAYNKKIAVEIEDRTPKKDGLVISTMHAAGFKMWRKVANNVKIDANKCRTIFREASAKFPHYRPFESQVLKLVSYAKQVGIGALSSADDYKEPLLCCSNSC
jgi:superfamily I DNA/RNA helicase